MGAAVALFMLMPSAVPPSRRPSCRVGPTPAVRESSRQLATRCLWLVGAVKTGPAGVFHDHKGIGQSVSHLVQCRDHGAVHHGRPTIVKRIQLSGWRWWLQNRRQRSEEAGYSRALRFVRRFSTPDRVTNAAGGQCSPQTPKPFRWWSVGRPGCAQSDNRSGICSCKPIGRAGTNKGRNRHCRDRPLSRIVPRQIEIERIVNRGLVHIRQH